MANNDVTIKVGTDIGSFKSDMKIMRDQLREVEKQSASLDKELQINGTKVEQLGGKYKSLESKLNIQSGITQRYKQEIDRLSSSLAEKRKSLEEAKQRI